jgi:arginyl-tRNA synthetase
VITAEVRRAVWDAAQDAIATGELPETITPASNTPDDPSTLRPVTPPRGGRPGRYVSTLPYHLAAPGTTPHQAAALLAARLETQPWIAAATATAGHLTVTVTGEALANLAIRIPQVQDCAASDILRGLTVPGPRPADLRAAPTWQDARTQLAAEVTGNLARTAGAEILPERTSPPPPPGPPEQRSPDDSPVAAALAYAGPDAVRYALLSGAPGRRPGGGVGVPVRYHLDNPVYAVRYAHAHAEATLRQAADLGLAPGAAAEFAPRLLSQPAERALLGALSWLPERVAWAARSRRPGEFARYLEELAGSYHDCRESCPALPFGGRSAPRDPPAIAARLWLVTAAAAAIGAGLALTGISAPARL